MLLAWKRVEEVQTQGDGSDMGMIVPSSWILGVNFEVHISGARGRPIGNA